MARRQRRKVLDGAKRLVDVWFRAPFGVPCFFPALNRCRLLRSTSLWLWLCVSLPATAAIPELTSETPLWRWLEGLSAIAQRADYEGIFVHSSDDDLLSMKVTYGFVEGRPREILQCLDQQPVQYIRQGDQVLRVDDGQVARPVRSYHGLTLNDWMVNKDQWKPYYEVRLLGNARVANREVYEVNITSKTSDRYAYKVWLDQQSGVVLGYLLLHDDKVLERYQFAQFKLLKEPPPSLLQNTKENQSLWALFKTIPPTSTEMAAETALESNSELLSRLVFPWLPPGFSVQRPNKGFYTDGLASFSVFVETVSGDNAQEAHKEGATSAISRGLSSNYQLILVGELPLATLTKIIEAATFR